MLESMPRDDFEPPQGRLGRVHTVPQRNRAGWIGGLGASLGVLILLALSGHHHHGAPLQPSPSAVGMPATLGGDVPVKPLRIALVLGPGFSAARQAREVGTLEDWLTGHVNPASRLTVIDTRRGTATAALPPSQWRLHDRGRSFVGSLSDALRTRLNVGEGQRVVVTLEHLDPLPGQVLSRLQVVLRQGASLPASVPLEPGTTVRRALDPGEKGAFAATSARAVISISNMTEAGEEHFP